jgi:hypothetical protein
MIMSKNGRDIDLLLLSCVIILLLIPISLIYRFIFFLINGYNPKVSIETFFPQSSIEFSWKGLEIIYDFLVYTPIEFTIIGGWCVLVAFFIRGLINKVKYSLLSKN